MKHADLIVARMERARQDRGISVAELGRRIGVDRKRLWYVLNGQRSMHVDEFVRLCAVLNMGLGCFLTKEMAADLAATRSSPMQTRRPHRGPLRHSPRSAAAAPPPLCPHAHRARRARRAMRVLARKRG